MDPSELVQETISSLTTFKDEERQSLAPWFYPTSMEVIGIKTTDLRIFLRQLKDILKKQGTRNTWNFAICLSTQKIFECRQLAYELLDKRRKLWRKRKLQRRRTRTTYHSNIVRIVSL